MGPAAPDWSIGRYETIAAQLLPAAQAVVKAAGLRAGERILDLGCGTGNAALLAAEYGTDVIGVDPALRLLEVAANRAALRRAQVTFRRGEAASLGVGDGIFDVILSVFGVIFANDAKAAAAEMARVLKPTGRIVLCAWVPDGTLFEMNSAAAEAVTQALGVLPQKPFSWHDPSELTQLLEPHGFSISVEEHNLAFTAASPREFFEVQARDHPLAVAGLKMLAELGKAERVRDELLGILQSGNEEPRAFRVTSRYVVATCSLLDISFRPPMWPRKEPSGS